jgi:hypothetical protein
MVNASNATTSLHNIWLESPCTHMAWTPSLDTVKKSSNHRRTGRVDGSRSGWNRTGHTKHGLNCGAARLALRLIWCFDRSDPESQFRVHRSCGKWGRRYRAPIGYRQQKRTIVSAGLHAINILIILRSTTPLLMESPPIMVIPVSPSPVDSSPVRPRNFGRLAWLR